MEYGVELFPKLHIMLDNVISLLKKGGTQNKTYSNEQYGQRKEIYK